MIPNPLRGPRCAWFLIAALHLVLGIRALRKGPTFDFQIYWDTGHGLGSGDVLYGGTEPYHELFLYGAVFAIGFRPLSMLSPEMAHILWTLIGLAALFACGWLLRDAMRRQAVARAGSDSPWPIALGMIALADPLLSNFHYGNTNTVLVCIIIVGFWANLRDRKFLSGVAFSLAAVIKVTPMVVLPWLILRREWRATAGFVTGLGLFVLVIPSLYYGPTRMVSETIAWVEVILLPALGQTEGAPDILTRAGASLPRIMDAVFAKVPAGEEVAMIHLFDAAPSLIKGLSRALGLMMVAVVLWVSRTRYTGTVAGKMAGRVSPPWDLSCAVVIATPALISPASHLGHFLQILPLLVVLAYRAMPSAIGMRTARWILIAGVGSGALLYLISLVLGCSSNHLFPVTVMNLILWIGGMWVITRRSSLAA